MLSLSIIKRFLLLSCIIGFTISFSTTSRAQSISRDVIGIAGETLIKDDISISFMIGEVIAELYYNQNRFLTAGFFQPDIEVKELIEKNTSKSLLVYPNPTSNGLIQLAFNNIPEARYTIEVVDLFGKVLQQQTIFFSKENFIYLNLDISSLSNGMYFIRVKNGIHFQGQVKVIKL